MTRFLTATAAALTLMTSTASAEDTFEEAKILAGEMLFKAECRRCHTAEAQKKDTYGPPLENIIGRPAGTHPDYEYSDALKNSGFAWTPTAIRAWMEDNVGFIPGTKMRHVGITDRTVQDFIIAYLAVHSESANAN